MNDIWLKKLKYGKLFFSVLKVIENAPNINNELIKLKNVIMTNNGAGITLEGGQGIGNDLFMQVKNMYRNTIWFIYAGFSLDLLQKCHFRNTKIYIDKFL